MRFGCLFGVFLMILAFGIMGFFMLPLLFEGNETVYDRQLITKDEYDRLRQQILDNASRSS